MKVLKWPREVGERGRQSSRGIKRSTCPDGPFKFHKPTFRINNGGREGGGGSNENGQSFRPVQIKYSIRGTWMEDDWIVSTGGKKKRDDWNTGEGEEWKREEKVGRLGGGRVAKWRLVFRGNDWISRVPARSVTEVASTLADRDRRTVESEKVGRVENRQGDVTSSFKSRGEGWN